MSAKLDRKTLSQVNREIFRKFPEMKGIHPDVKAERKAGREGRDRFVLTYKGKAALPGGGNITRIVRVVADQRGRILRMSTSK